MAGTAELKIDVSQFITGLGTAVTALRGAVDKIQESTNFEINLDSKDAKKQIDTLSDSFKTLKGTTASDIERIRNSMALLVIGGKQGTDEFAKLKKELQDLTKTASTLDDAMKEVDDSLKIKPPTGLLGQFKELGAGIKSAFSADSIGGLVQGLGSLSPQLTAIVAGFAVITGGIASFAKGAVEGGKEFETYETQLTTLMGSTVAAKDRIKELAKFGAETPFELPEIVKAEKVLLGFGLTGQKAMQMTGKSSEQLRTVIGDVAAGTGVKFDELALTFGKFSSGATGEAISRLQELGIVTREELKDVGVQFSKSGELVSPISVALTKATEIAQSKFGGGMSALSQTAEGLMSTINDTVSQGITQTGAPIFQGYKQILGVVGSLLNSDFVQKSVLPSVQGFLQSTLDSINEFVDFALPKLKPFADFIGGVLLTIFRNFGTAVVFAWNIIKNVVGGVVDNLLEAFAPLGEALSGLVDAFGVSGESSLKFSDVLKGIGEIIGLVGKVIVTLLVQPLKLVVSTFSEGIKIVTGWVTGIQESAGATQKASTAIQSFNSVLVFVKQSVNGFIAGIKEASVVLFDFWTRIKSLDFKGALDVLASGFDRVKKAANTEFAETFKREAEAVKKSSDDLIRSFDKQIEELQNNRKKLSEEELKATKETLTAKVRESEIDDKNKQLLTTKIANIRRGADEAEKEAKAKETAYQLAKLAFDEERKKIEAQSEGFEQLKKEEAVKKGVKLTEQELKDIELFKLARQKDILATAEKTFAVTQKIGANGRVEYAVNFKGLTDKDKNAVKEITDLVSGLGKQVADVEYNITFKGDSAQSSRDLDQLIKAFKARLDGFKDSLSPEVKFGVSVEQGLAELENVKTASLNLMREIKDAISIAPVADRAKLNETLKAVQDFAQDAEKRLPALKLKFEFDRRRPDLTLIDDETEKRFTEQLLSLEQKYREDLLKYEDNQAVKSRITTVYNDERSRIEIEYQKKTNGAVALGYALQEDLLKSFLDSSAELQDNAREEEQQKRQEDYKKQTQDLEGQRARNEISLREYQAKVAEIKEKTLGDEAVATNPKWLQRLNNGLSNAIKKSLPAFEVEVSKSQKNFNQSLDDNNQTLGQKFETGLSYLTDLGAQGLLVASQVAVQGGNALKAFGNTVLRGLVDVLTKQLTIAITGAIFTEVQTKGLLGLATGAIITAALGFLFNQALGAIGLKEGTDYVSTNSRVIKLQGYNEDQYLTRLDEGESVITREASSRGRNREAIRFMLSGGDMQYWNTANRAVYYVNQNAIKANDTIQMERKLEQLTSVVREGHAVLAERIDSMSAISKRHTTVEVSGELKADTGSITAILNEKNEAKKRRG